MPFAITQACCSDASCVEVCPVNCIHPRPDEPDFGLTESLYVDPQACIDCGACADACPVDAVRPVAQLTGPNEVFVELNAAYYRERVADPEWDRPTFPDVRADQTQLRVAVVGTGPAASYAARWLLSTTNAEVTMIDRLPVPGGLVRSGVAPDHVSTKQLADTFRWTYQHLRTRMLMNVEVGADLTHDELLEHHHAVVYGVGARADRALGVPGEDLPGSMPATRFVAWYNAHPDEAATTVDLSHERAVVVGNGNVALDVARILVTDPAQLERTDVGDAALTALRGSRIREVVVLGRRGPDDAAFTRPELLMLPHLPDVDVVVDDGGRVAAELDAARPGSKAAVIAALPRWNADLSQPPAPGTRIVLRFYSAPAEVVGTDRVEAVRVSDTEVVPGGVRPVGEPRTVAAGLVVRSTGHRGSPVPGLPFDDRSAVVPNVDGRVVDPATGDVVPGAYVVGWIKRGAVGGIGANRTCAGETVRALSHDAGLGLLPTPRSGTAALRRLLRRRVPDLVETTAMNAILDAEVSAGAAVGRPRVKLATVDEMVAAGRRRRRTRVPAGRSPRDA